MTDRVPKKTICQCDKCRGNAGETLVETLVSILISALALLVLATAIGTSVNIVRSSKNKMDGMYASESEFVAAYTKTEVDEDGEDGESPEEDSTPVPTTVTVGVRLGEAGSTENVKVYTDKGSTVGVYRRVP